DLNSRLITVADIFVALREDRPYRPGMNWDQIAKIMNKLIIVEGLDKENISIIMDNQKFLNQKWEELSSPV
ncbi:MAG: phosphohydrolase, partial [Syntrophomonas sp.]